ncbi:unnamed protein product, partial [Ixodes persulcatus]
PLLHAARPPGPRSEPRATNVSRQRANARSHGRRTPSECRRARQPAIASGPTAATEQGVCKAAGAAGATGARRRNWSRYKVRPPRFQSAFGAGQGMLRMAWIRMLVALAVLLSQGVLGSYHGIKIGPLKTQAHGVRGDVYAANDVNFYIANFYYDGDAPAAHFQIGTESEPGPHGTNLPDENGSTAPLKGYRGANITIRVPDNKKITDYKYLGVWCESFGVNFGHVVIPSDFKLPQPQTIGTSVTGAHGVKIGSVVLTDANTIQLTNFHYDGAGPDAHFFVSPEPKPPKASGGTKLLNENGSNDKLPAYTGKDVTLKLPGKSTWADYKWFSVFCVMADTSFVTIDIPNVLTRSDICSGNHAAQSLPSVFLSLGLALFVALRLGQPSGSS